MQVLDPLEMARLQAAPFATKSVRLSSLLKNHFSVAQRF
jgi:hypothetical protein